MMRPLILIDVDGVVNAFDKRGWPDGTRWHDLRAGGEDGETYRLRIAGPALDAIERWTGRADVQWHTTWQQHVYNITDQLNFPRLPIANAPEFLTWNHSSATAWWKVPAVLRALEEDRPLVWIDDDISYDRRARQQVREASPHTPRKLVCPSSIEGLVTKQIDGINAWLDKVDEWVAGSAWLAEAKTR